MATIAVQQPFTECFKAVLSFGLFFGNRNQSMARRTVKTLAHGPRVLLPSDVYFDPSVQKALKLLQSSQHELLQQKSESSLPSLDSSSSADSSVESFHDDEEADQDDQDQQTKMKQQFIVQVEGKPQDHPNQDETTRKRADIWMARQQSALASLERSGNQDCVTLTLMGTKGINQDAAMVVQPLVPSATVPTTLIGCFDGHGEMGHLVAEFCRQQLEHELTQEMQQVLSNKDSPHDSLVDRLKTLVEEVDQSLPENVADLGGSTASMVLQVGRSVYLLNTGDSQSLICAFIPSTNECVILEKTRRHSPDLLEEQHRILQAGAKIEDGYVVYNSLEQEDIEYALGMSRSLGDRSAPGVIATPTVTRVSIPELKQRALEYSNHKGQLKPEDVCLMGLSVSDGVTDVASMDEIASSLVQSFYGSDCKNKSHLPHPVATADYWIHQCAQRWKTLEGDYRDDITIAAAKLL